MKNKKIKIYSKANGNLTTVEEKNAQIKTEVDQIFGDKYERLVFLKSNPFFYNHELDKDKVKFLDEYLIVYKKRQNSFGEFIHSNDYTIKEKIRIIKKSFKFWNKDYNKERKENVSKSSNALKAVEVAKIKKFRFYQLILLVIGFVFLLFITNLDSRIWASFKNTDLGYYLYNIAFKLFNTTWVLSVGIIGIYIFFGTFIYLSFFNEIIKNYKYHYKESSKMVKKTKVNLKKDQKKNSKRAYKYYLKNIKSGKLIFHGVKISEAAPGVLNLDFHNQVSNEIVQRTGKMKKRQWIFATSKNLLLILSLLIFVFIVGAVLVQVIIG